MAALSLSPLVFVMPSLRTGGGNRVFVELAQQLAGKYNVEIIVPATIVAGSQFPVHPDVTVTPVGIQRTGFIAALYNMKLLLLYVALKRRTATIIVSDPVLALGAVLFPHRRTYRFIQADDYHLFDDLHVLGSRLALKIYKTLTKLSYRYPIQYLFNSRFVFDSFIAVSRRTDVPCQLVHPGVDLVRFSNRHGRSLTADKVNICVVGRSHPIKGLQDFLTAWAELKTELSSAVESVLVISSDDLSDFDLSAVTLVRPQGDDDIAAAYNRAHIFIATSRWDGFGLPPLEAMACGCAIITSDCGGSREYAQANENCLLYPPGDIARLKQLIVQLVHDRQLQGRLAERGQQTAQGFSWNRAATQLEAIVTAN